MEKKLIVLAGIPGSGKSTFAANYELHNPNTFIVASDKLRLELFGRVDDFTHEDFLWSQFEKMIIEKAKTYQTIIADSSATTNLRRLRWSKLFSPHFNNLELVYFNIPFATCLKRNEARHMTIPYEDMIIMRQAFEKPSQEVEKAYNKIIYVNEWGKTSFF